MNFKKHKTALHLHTLQSDGRFPVAEVINAYIRAGYTILSITDHNYHRMRSASPYPLKPYPHNYSANTIWPWSDYGGLDREELGIIDIEGNELSYRQYMISLYNDYGVWYEDASYNNRIGEAPYEGIVNANENEIWEDKQMFAIRDKGGLAFMWHPSVSDAIRW